MRRVTTAIPPGVVKPVTLAVEETLVVGPTRLAALAEDAVGRGMFSDSPTLGWLSDFAGCRHFCSVANGVHGCCADGSNCTPDTPPPPCTDPNYALCPEENFCCRASTLTVMDLIDFFHLQPRNTNATETLPALLHVVPPLTLV